MNGKTLWSVIQKIKKRFILPLETLKGRKFEHFFEFNVINYRKVYKQKI